METIPPTGVARVRLMALSNLPKNDRLKSSLPLNLANCPLECANSFHVKRFLKPSFL